eukprot:8990261-Karenia_brevis.AAC.1
MGRIGSTGMCARSACAQSLAWLHSDALLLSFPQQSRYSLMAHLLVNPSAWALGPDCDAKRAV